MKSILLFIIKVYRYFLSPFLGQHCRFEPTCSCYAHAAIKQHGAATGGWLALRRLSRCHPWHEVGYDPVPERLTPEQQMAPDSREQNL